VGRVECEGGRDLAVVMLGCGGVVARNGGTGAQRSGGMGIVGVWCEVTAVDTVDWEAG